MLKILENYKYLDLNSLEQAILNDAGEIIVNILKHEEKRAQVLGLNDAIEPYDILVAQLLEQFNLANGSDRESLAFPVKPDLFQRHRRLSLDTLALENLAKGTLANDRVKPEPEFVKEVKIS